MNPEASIHLRQGGGCCTYKYASDEVTTMVSSFSIFKGA
jgi:hypothetical protein